MTEFIWNNALLFCGLVVSVLESPGSHKHRCLPSALAVQHHLCIWLLSAGIYLYCTLEWGNFLIVHRMMNCNGITNFSLQNIDFLLFRSSFQTFGAQTGNLWLQTDSDSLSGAGIQHHRAVQKIPTSMGTSSIRKFHLHEFHPNQHITFLGLQWVVRWCLPLHHHTYVLTGTFAQRYVVARDYIPNVSRVPIRVFLVRDPSSLPRRQMPFCPPRHRLMNNIMLKKTEKLEIRK